MTDQMKWTAALVADIERLRSRGLDWWAIGQRFGLSQYAMQRSFYAAKRRHSHAQKTAGQHAQTCATAGVEHHLSPDHSA
jgi:hypothetical protein